MICKQPTLPEHVPMWQMSYPVDDELHALREDRTKLLAEIEEWKQRYAKDITELNQRLIDRREAYEEYCAKVKKKAL